MSSWLRSPAASAIPRRLFPAFRPPVRMLVRATLTALTAGLLALASRGAAQTSFTQFEGRQTHPIGLTPDGSKLLALNPPDARLSVFDVSNTANPIPVLLAEIAVGLEPVSLRARTEDEVWVVNEVSDSVSIVSLSRGVVVATLPCPDEPADVVFAQGKAFVSGARNNLLRVFDVTTRVEVAAISLQGLQPRALAVDADGTKIYAAFQNSGNRTTILPSNLAPPPPAPSNTNLPAPPQTAIIVAANDPRISHVLLDHDVAVISATNHQVLGYFSDAGTSLFDLALRPGADELWVANTEALNLVRFEPNLKGHFADNRVTRLELPTGAATAFDLNPGINYTLLPNPAAQSNALAQPMALAFTANGRHVWVAAFASDRVAKLDANDGTVLARVDMRAGAPNGSRRMRGPRGLTLHEGRLQLFVLNKMANSISIISTATDQLLAEIPAGSYDPTPAAVQAGRGFLFDARLSGNGTVACGTCHLDADRDGLAWDLGDPNGTITNVMGANLAIHDTTPQSRSMHPMKGPMTTQTLRGLATNQLLHWRGDRPNLRAFNPTFRDLMGGALLPDADLDAMMVYLATLRHHPNPNRKLDNTLPATLNGGDPTRGRSLFNLHINHCAVCHTPPSGSDNNVDDPRNIGATQSFKTPPLQTVYQRALLDTRVGVTNVAGFGLAHDGTGSRHFLPTIHFYELDQLSGVDFADVTAFVLAFETGTAPAVGASRTLVSGANSTNALADLALLEAQARLTNVCDLVARGRVAGVWRQYFYDKVSQLYRPDRAGEAALPRTNLLALLDPNDALTFLATPPGTGVRLGGDRDGDGWLDADEPRPALEVARTPAVLRPRWPESERGWLLEKASALSAPWQPDLRPRASDGTNQFVEQPFSEEPSQFFRLRRVW